MAPKKPGRQPKPPTDVEQAEIDGRTELTHQWITSTFACTISAIQHNKRGKSVAGPYYLAQLQDRLCFNKGEEHSSNATYIIVRDVLSIADCSTLPAYSYY